MEDLGTCEEWGTMTEERGQESRRGCIWDGSGSETN